MRRAIAEVRREKLAAGTLAALVAIAAALVVLAAAVASVGAPAAVYPRAVLTPVSPVEGDAVSLRIIVGASDDGCFPTYETSHSLVHHPIYCIKAPCPQWYDVVLKYATSRTVCYDFVGPMPIEYGPTFNFGALGLGQYTVLDGADTVIVFSVREAGTPPAKVTLSGTVSEDTRPLEMFKVIAGARVYLQQPMGLILKSGAFAPEIPYTTIDSAKTDGAGAFAFAVPVVPSSYRLLVTHAEYQSLIVGAYVTGDTSVSVALLRNDAAGDVVGTVSSTPCKLPFAPNVKCRIDPVAGCSVSVHFPPILYMLKGARDQALVPVRGELFATVVTDASGRYRVAKVPIEYRNQPLTVVAHKAGLASADEEVTLLPGAGTTTVDFLLEQAYANVNSVTVDGVVYSVATEKRLYRAGEYLTVRYRISNQSMATVTFEGSSSCMFDLSLAEAGGSEFYRYLKNVACTRDIRYLTLSPGKFEEYEFPPYYLAEGRGDVTVTARLAGATYDRSAVSVGIVVEKPTAVAGWRNAGAGSSGCSVRWEGRSRSLVLTLDRGQKVRVEACDARGRMLPGLSKPVRMEGGANVVHLGGGMPADGVIVLRVRGESFSVTKMVRMAGAVLAR